MLNIKIIQTAERVSENVLSDNYVLQRFRLAYYKASEIVSGNVLEIGTGSGYGISIISPYTDEFVTIDKNHIDIDYYKNENVYFHKMNISSLNYFPDNYFDYVISFQVIEHIKKDSEMIKEIYRILAPGGKLLISTPNRNMTLTRNPWHIREYIFSEFSYFIGKTFAKVEAYGVFGNEKVMEYYEMNKIAVQKITQFDVFNFQYILPGWLLKIPYNITNRINRKTLLNKNRFLTLKIDVNDFYLKAIDDNNAGCLDLFFIASK